MAPSQLKVRQLASLYLKVPPDGYGGTERVIANISAYQCAFLGYEVHVYASKDSEIIAYTEETAKRLGHSCKKNSCASEIVVYDAAGKGKHGKLVHRHPNKKAMKFSPDGFMSQYYHEKLIALLLDDDAQDPCDVIHFHDHFSYAAMLGATGLLFTKCVSTVHNQQPSLSYKHFRYPVTALSQNHFDFLDRKYGPLKIVEGVPYVHHGIICPETYFPKHAGYVTWLARLNPEKGPDIGVLAAKRAGVPIVFGGSILHDHQIACFNSMVKEHVTHNYGLLVPGSWVGLGVMPTNLEESFNWKWKDLTPSEREELWGNLAKASSEQPGRIGQLLKSHYTEQFKDQVPTLKHAQRLKKCENLESSWETMSYSQRLKALEAIQSELQGSELRTFESYFAPQMELLRKASTLRELNLLDIWEHKSVDSIRAEIDLMSSTDLGGGLPVVFVGVIGDRQRNVLFGNALALLLPHSWTEPFGLTMLEATSLGTPMIPITEYNAKNYYGNYIGKTGGLEEILEEGVNGLGVKVTGPEDAVDKMAQAIDRVDGLSRKTVRECFERSYTIEKQVTAFDEVYGKVLSRSPTGMH